MPKSLCYDFIFISFPFYYFPSFPQNISIVFAKLDRKLFQTVSSGLRNDIFNPIGT